MRSKYLRNNLHSLSSTAICFRSAQIILAGYHEIHVSRSEGTLKVLSWRQLERITIASYIIIFAYLKSEGLPEETQIALGKALVLLTTLGERFSVAGKIRDTLLSLGRASGKPSLR